MIYEINNHSKLKIYEKYAFYNHKWTNARVPFKLYNFFIRYLKTNKFFGKIVYFIFKIIQYVFQPLFIILEYIYRVFFTLKILYRVVTNSRYLPEIL